MADDNLIQGLNHLIHTNRDAEAGLLSAANNINNSELETLFAGYAKQHAAFAGQLKDELDRVGGEVTDRGVGLGEALHRGWMDLKSIITGYSPSALLAFCESGEESAEIAYYDVANAIGSGQTHTLIHKQYEQIKGFKAHLCRLVRQTEHGLEFPKNEEPGPAH